MKNDLGVDPDEWFPNPLDKMPIATDKQAKIKLSFDGCYNYNKLKKEGLIENPDESDEIEETKESDNIHEVMYQLATKNGTTITMGGSEEVQK